MYPEFNHSIPRRKFIGDLSKTAAGLAVLGWQPGHLSLTVQQVMDLVLKEGNLSRIADTVDTLKTGHAAQPVTGIITTMFPTINVIQEAIKHKANFIIAHEPAFYNHKDDKGWVKDNGVLRQKLAMIDKHQIVIWRFHDYCHALQPDAVSYGVARKAGWERYYKTGQLSLTIPAISLKQLAQHLKTSLGISQVRVIGDLAQSCTRIALMPGAWGGQRQVNAVETEKPDVLIVGELSEWETAEYIRDANLLGQKKGLIVLGHSVSEEPGMEYFAEWLRPKLPGIKVTHVSSNDPFTWL
ncbi:Nif3-like dinuclear metal center hexameric protein [Chitinophaga horti]|uniref:Nif3-like dinuclear metal center hexameric protein n=1 Tax=Chitinophaga horti TaxID=2920382 RepID=A0ABY6J5P4_9BACT|nr:Nif3-like dinuclear metal center hexameric protein [Chitinophaga horti]UYQ94988.1 Nif3-like dinuclear metal center hexameric protein [Chitinophaga horti]